MGSNTSIAKQLDAGLLIINAYEAGGQDLHNRLSQVGYDGAAFNVLRGLWTKAGGARASVEGERGDQFGATRTLNVLHAKVQTQVSAVSQIAKTVFAADIDARTTLGLEQPKPRTSTEQPAADGAGVTPKPVESGRDQSLAALLDRGRILYTNALNHPELLGPLGAVGYTSQRLQQELNDVTALGMADAVQEREKGESTASTAAQQAALAEMQAWIQRFRSIVVVALKDRPEYLKAMGFKPRGGKR